MSLLAPSLLNGSMSGGVSLFSDVGVMLVEGRTPEPSSPRGHKEGPHLHPLTPQVQHHTCTEGDFLCERAAGLRRHLSLLSENSAPMTIDVLLSPDCPCGSSRASSVNICCLASSEDLLIEQWTVSILSAKPSQKTCEVPEKVLLQAIRSQLHFSQLSAWYSLGKVKNVTYRLSHPVGCPEFSRPPLHHDFPIAKLPSGSYIKVSLKSLPRLDGMPSVVCPIHSSVSPLSTTVTVFKSVFAELGHCLLDPPARIPAVKQGFTMWRDNKTSSPTKSRHKPVRSPSKNKHLLVPGLLDDRMQSGCKHIGKHHCEDDFDEKNSPPYSFRSSYFQDEEKSCSKQPSDNCYDLNKPHTRGVLGVLRNQVCNRVSIPDGSTCKTENIFSAILKTGNSSGSNPLKRKRSALETSSKRLLSGDKSSFKACSDLAECFTRLKITGKEQPSQVSTMVAKSPVQEGTFIKPRSVRHIPSPIPLRKSNWVTDSSSEETECDSPRSCGPEMCLPTSSPKLSSPRRVKNSSLLGNFEENVLKGRLKPVSVVEGFSADLGASGAFCPQHLRLPVTVSFFSFEPYSAPYLGHIKLSKKGYTVPRSGTIQVTLFNPLGTVIKMFVVSYDMKDMPDNSLTIVRQRAWGPGNKLTYLIHLRFCSSKSGRISLHSDIKMLISRQYDVDSSICLDMDSSAQLRSVTEQSAAPKYSLKTNSNKRCL